MLNKSGWRSIIVLISPVIIATASADSELIRLKNNPFSRPQLKAEEVLPRQQVSRPAAVEEPVSIFIEATLVSENGSMVIANGELIAIGDRFEGMKLVEVREGIAVFRKGRKTRTYRVGVMGEK